MARRVTGTLGFYQYSRQSYAGLLAQQDYYDEVTITDHAEGGGTYGEFNFQWKNFGRHGTAIRMDVFGDAWWMLEDPRLASLFAWLPTVKHEEGKFGKSVAMDPTDFCRYLIHLGFVDFSKNPLT